MSRKEDEAFKKWGEDMMDEVEAGETDALKAWLALPVAREVFRGTIGQNELYRRMNKVAEEQKEVDAMRAELEEWYEVEAPKNAQLIAERDQLRQQLADYGSGGPPPAEGSGLRISAEDLDAIKAKAQKAETLDKLLPSVLSDMGRIVQDAIKNNFDVDTGEVLKVSISQGVAPWQAYLGLTSEERQKREEASREDERKKWFEEGRRAAMTNSPDHFTPSGPSMVDFIQDLNKGAAAGGKDPLDRTARISAALKELNEGNFSS